MSELGLGLAHRTRRLIQRVMQLPWVMRWASSRKDPVSIESWWRFLDKGIGCLLGWDEMDVNDDFDYDTQEKVRGYSWIYGQAPLAMGWRQGTIVSGSGEAFTC